MNYNHLKLVMAAFWLLVAVLTLGQERLLPGGKAGPMGGPLLSMSGLFACVLVVYNLFRWWYGERYRRARRRARPVNPLAVRKDDDESEQGPVVPNPDFDFVKLPDSPDR